MIATTTWCCCLWWWCPHLSICLDYRDSHENLHCISKPVWMCPCSNNCRSSPRTPLKSPRHNQPNMAPRRVMKKLLIKKFKTCQLLVNFDMFDRGGRIERGEADRFKSERNSLCGQRDYSIHAKLMLASIVFSLSAGDLRTPLCVCQETKHDWLLHVREQGIICHKLVDLYVAQFRI